MSATTPPSWLDTTLIENGLRKGFQNDNLKVLKSEASIANAAGDHYGSQMYRIKLTIQITPDKMEELSVIAKVFPDTKFAEERLTGIIFNREGRAYSEVLPTIHSQLQKAYPQDEKLYPELCFYEETPNWIMVMKDLRRDGYTLGNRIEGLDINHATLVLKSMAKLHAASIPAMKAHPNVYKPYNWCFWVRENKDISVKFFEGPFAGLLRDLPNWPEFEGKDMYIEKLNAMQNTFIDKALQAWENNESKLRVLVHGDSWTNNFMFRYEDGRPVGIKYVDFQIANINSPVLDIQYFIFTSVKPDLKFDHIDYFLEVYYNTFEDTLKRLGHTLDIPFGLQELKREFEGCYFWGMAVLFCFCPLISAPSEDILKFDEFYEEDKGASFEKAYRKPKMREMMMRAFKFFNQKGVL